MIFPMFAMVLLTFIVAVIAIRARVASVRLKQINLGYYRLMQAEVSGQVPERVQVTTRCFNNLFEVPILFYVACIAGLALGHISAFTLIIAWLFVISRIVHTWIHLTYNTVLHRMPAFWLGLILVLVLWIEQVLMVL